MISQQSLSSLLEIKQTLIPREEHPKFIASFLLICVSFVLEALSVSLIFLVANAILQPFATDTDGSVALLSITRTYISNDYPEVALILIIPVTYLIKNVILYAINRYFIFVAMSVQKKLGSDLYRGYILQNLRFFERTHSSEIIRNIITEVSHTANIVESIIYLASELAILAVLATLIIVVNPWLGLVIGLVLSSFTIAYYFLIWNRIKILGKERQKLEGQRIRTLKESLLCIKEIKVFQRENFFVELFDPLHQRYSDALAGMKVLSQLPRYMLETLLVFSGMGTLGVVMASSSSIVEAASIMSMLAAIMLRVSPSISRISQCYNTLRFYMPVAMLVSEELKRTKDENPKQQPTTVSDKHRAETVDTIELRNIYFSYDNNKVVLKNLSFEFGKGDCVGIVGPSGSGKSTFLDLMLGLISPQSGERIVNQKNVGFVGSLENSHFGYVPQKTFLLDDTIAANVAFGVNPEAIDIDRVRFALHKVKLAGVVDKLSYGIYTEIGEDGSFLSGGQTQRLSIARMIYQNRGVLIFDEATSALDTATEQDILLDIEKIRGDRPVIIVTHREQALRYCNKVFQMHDGTLRPRQP